MPTVEAERRIAADPGSVALLLTGPAAGQLWPGAVRVQAAPARLQLRTRVPGRGKVDAEVTVGAPRTMPTSYRAEFRVDSDQLPPIRGRLDLSYDTSLAPARTRASLEFDYGGDHPDRLRRLAQAYLDNIAQAAESTVSTPRRNLRP